MAIINYFNKNLKEIFQNLSLTSFSLYLFSFFISISNSVSAIIIIFFFIGFLRSKNKINKIEYVVNSSINKSILLFFLFVLISYFWSDKNFFFQALNKYAVLLIIPFLDLLSFKKKEKKIAGYFFIIGIIFNVIWSFFILTLYQYEILDNLLFIKNNHYKSEVFLRGFIDHSSLSILVSFVVFILLSRQFKKEKYYKKWKDIILYFLILILVLFLLNSYGRTGFFALIILLPVFLLIKKPKNIKFIILFSFLFILISINISNPFKSRLDSIFNSQKETRTQYQKIESEAQYMVDSLGKDIKYWKEKINKDISWQNKIIEKKEPTTMGTRYEIWKTYKNQIIKKPLFGYGIGGTNKIVHTGNGNYPHNSYILITFELGVIGLILLLNIFYVQIKKAFFCERKEVLKIIFPLFFLICMMINDYIIIYNTACFFSLYSFLLYSKNTMN